MISTLGWIGNIALLIGAILIAYKKRAGFLFNFVGLIFHISVAYLMKMNFLIICDSGFACVCIWSFIKWGREEQGNYISNFYKAIKRVKRK